MGGDERPRGKKKRWDVLGNGDEQRDLQKKKKTKKGSGGFWVDREVRG